MNKIDLGEAKYHLETQNFAYNNFRDILKWHGPFVCFLYIIFFYIVGNLSLTRWWFWIGKCKWIVRYFHSQHISGKTKPAWQDLGVLLLALCTGALVLWASQYQTPPWFVAYIGWYLLFDMIFGYHARIFWFDRLEPKKKPDALKVFSHTRILFQALINFAQSIFIFGILYSHYTQNKTATSIYQASFEVATTLSRPESLQAPTWLIDTQVIVSIFFLVVVISILAAVGYTRKELAPDPMAD